MTVPATHMKRASPTDPERAKIEDGVANIPVPTMRFKILRVRGVSEYEYGILGFNVLTERPR